MFDSRVFCESARTYYDWLKENKKGLSSVDVLHIEKAESCFRLKLASPLRFPEQVMVKLDEYICSSETEIQIGSYDRKTRVLVVVPVGVFISKLNACPCELIRVVSDLTFLVKNVADWYQMNGSLVALPRSKPILPPPDQLDWRYSPSEEQLQAVRGVFEQPFSYVWGAPGTGKTKFVLAQCVLQYVQAERRVLILAPTNNAIEQTLRGVLPVLQDFQIPLLRVLRLGASSHEFTEEYPEVCEDITLDARISDLTAQIAHIVKYCSYLEFSANIAAAIEAAQSIVQELYRCRLCRHTAIQELPSIKKTILTEKEAFEALNRNNTDLSGKLKKIDKLVSSFQFRLFRKLSINAARSVMQQREETVLDLQRVQASIKKQHQHLSDLEELLQVVSSEAQDIQTSDNLISALISLTTPFVKYSKTLGVCVRLLSSDQNNDGSDILKELAELQANIESRRSSYEDLLSLSREDALARKLFLEEELEKLSARNVAARLPKTHVLAATVDCYISRIFTASPLEDHVDESDIYYTPKHVFLDEAAYCPLAKGMTLLRANVPLSFFGDHMQLPPVCEIDDKLFKRYPKLRNVFLWSQSSLYAEDVFLRAMEDLYEGYYKYVPPSFASMRKFDLTRSYRFGPSLAAALAGPVYASGFCGAGDHNTQIIVIDVQHTKSGRSSISEVIAIQEYLASHSEQDFSVLTPYRKQLALLRETMPNLADQCFTVHGSQGREWDTVIFSVVDTTKAYFTNSKNPVSHGLQVINTAVSRARHKLIIVCDVSYWQRKRDQLICRLISASVE